MAHSLLHDMATAAKAANDAQKAAIKAHKDAQSAKNVEEQAAETADIALKISEADANQAFLYKSEDSKISALKDKSVQDVADILGVAGQASETTVMGLYEISITDQATLASTLAADNATQTSALDTYDLELGDASSFSLGGGDVA